MHTAWLKADLHAHSADDPTDDLSYSSEMLIDAAAEAGMEVLALTCHNGAVVTPRLQEYARRRRLLLVPGIELTLEKRHVLVINPTEAQCRASTLDELHALRGQGEAIIAPHPFYPSRKSLRRRFAENKDLFDAVEYCHFHTWGFNPNRKAVEAAERLGLPVIATSDSHGLPYRAESYTWLECKPEVDDVARAVRQGRTRWVSHRVPVSRACAILAKSAIHELLERIHILGEEAVLHD